MRGTNAFLPSMLVSRDHARQSLGRKDSQFFARWKGEKHVDGTKPMQIHTKTMAPGPETMNQREEGFCFW